MNPTVTPAQSDIMTTTSVDKLLVSVLLNTLVLGAVGDMNSFWDLVILLSSDIWEGRNVGVKCSKAKEIKLFKWIENLLVFLENVLHHFIEKVWATIKTLVFLTEKELSPGREYLRECLWDY